MFKAITCFIALFVTVVPYVYGQVEFCGEQLPLNKEYVKMKLLQAIKKNRKDATSASVQQRAKRYIPFITTVLQSYGLPEDLRYIPFVESRLNRYSMSKAGAGGLWQLMPATASGQGLIVSPGNLDERNLVIKSTHAACRLLLRLHQQFGSWTLAAAAYNFGPGAISKRINQQGTQNYYEMKLNPETAAYVYEIVSFKILYSLLQQNNAAGYYKNSSPAVADTAEIRKEALSTLVISYDPNGRRKNWQKSGFKRMAANADTVPNWQPDTVTVAATLLGKVDLSHNSELAFTTAGPVDISGHHLPRNTIVKGRVYDMKQRISIDIPGIDISQHLKSYNVLVYDLDGLQGIATTEAKGKRLSVAEGYRVTLKFIKE